MIKFEVIEKGIHRLCIPFDNIYTTVFLLKSKNGTILFDTATTESDVNNYILPALKNENAVPDIVICSHSHSDHAGGLEYVLKAFPKVQNKTYKDGEVLFSRFKILELKGHSKDSVGILDLATKTLLSGDALQQLGVGKYKTHIEDKTDYLNTIEKLKNTDINKIIFSHNYEPFGWCITRADLLNCYKLCEETAK